MPHPSRKHIPKSVTQPISSTQFVRHPLFQLSLLGVFLLIQNVLFHQPFTPFFVGVYVASWIVLAIAALTTSKIQKLSLVSLGLLGLQLWQLTQTGSLTRQLITLSTLFFIGTVTVFSLSSMRLWVTSLLELASTPFLLGWGYLRSLASTYVDGHLPFSLRSFTWHRRLSLDHVRSLVGGILLSVPIIVLLLAMFSAGDAIFAHFVHQFLSFSLPGSFWSRFWFTAVVLTLALPIFNLHTESLRTSPQRWLGARSLVNELTIVMSLVAITVGLFLFVQSPYIFVQLEKETSLASFGVATYSEYVRQGFSELLKVAVVLFGLLWAGLTIWRTRTSENKPYLLYAQLVVLGEFFIFVLSLFRRVWLYQAFHGWTLAKIYGVWLLIGLVGFVITLAARHLWQKPWVRVEVLWVLCWLCLGGWWNAEQFIVRSGHLPTVNDKVDYVYLARMSADGYEGWLLSYAWARNVIETQLQKNPASYSEADRREIAYAGRVIVQVSRTYEQLLQTHASDDQLRAYYQALAEHEEHALQRQFTHLDTLTQLTQPLAVELQESNDRFTSFRRDLQSKHDELSRTQDSLNQLRNLLAEPAPNWSRAKYLITVPAFVDFSFGGDWGSGYCSDFVERLHCVDPGSSFYGWHPGNSIETTRVKKSAPLTQFFTMNAADQAALTRLLQEIPHRELLGLHAGYFDLKRRIQLQPPADQGYEEDVNFSSPLLWE